MRGLPIHALAGIAMMGAMGADIEVENEEGKWEVLNPRKPSRYRCTYREPAGPPYPTTRQQRRALQRLSDAALARIR